jgi:hypothetical protein
MNSLRMGKIFLKATLIFALLCSFLSCSTGKTEVERAFYYWKSSEYSLTRDELSCLRDLNIRKLYVKFFEVDYDSVLGAVPDSKTELHIWNYSQNYENDSLLVRTMSRLEIVPVIYIRNKVLRKMPEAGLDSLASNILYLTGRYYDRQFKNRQADFSEIQLDCDWTEDTRENYFHLIRQIKQNSKKSVSCTLRLYPYKYRNRMGVPPADKAVLMCYNLVNPFADEDKNSILSLEELEGYLKKSGKYPVPLDVAMPVFSWMLVWQNNHFAGAVSHPPLGTEDFLKPDKPLWYIVTKDREFDNMYLRVGDKVKIEDVTPETLQQSLRLIRKYVSSDACGTVILFHLDSDNLKKLNNETINHIFPDSRQ